MAALSGRTLGCRWGILGKQATVLRDANPCNLVWRTFLVTTRTSPGSRGEEGRCPSVALGPRTIDLVVAITELGDEVELHHTMR